MYTVIFSSQRFNSDHTSYAEMAELMEQLAAQQEGFIKVQSARDADGYGITVSYWADLNAIRLWKQQVDHRTAQALGREKWYEHYEVHICKVDRSYHYEHKQKHA